MAQQSQPAPIEQVLALLTEQGSDGLLEAARILPDAARLFERERFLNAAPDERTSERRDYANGFKPKRLRTRLGELDLRIPQVRNSDFYTQVLDRGTRSECAVKLALAEMYVQGVSTRKVNAITEQLCAFEVTSSRVSRATTDSRLLQVTFALDLALRYLCPAAGAAAASHFHKPSGNCVDDLGFGTWQRPTLLLYRQRVDHAAFVRLPVARHRSRPDIYAQ